MNLARNIAGILAVAIGSGYLYKLCDSYSILPVDGEINHNVGIYYTGEAISLIWASFTFMNYAKTRYDHAACWAMLAISWLNLANSLNVNNINEWQLGNLILLPVIVVFSIRKYKKHNERCKDKYHS